METLEKIDVREIKLDELQIEMECIGQNDYRFRRNAYDIDTEELYLEFDLEVYCDDESNITSLQIENITAYSDEGEYPLESFEHEILHEKIEKSIAIIGLY